MVEVNLWSGLRRFTGGATVLSVEAKTIGDMLDAIVALHPGLAPVIEAGVSVAVNGEVVLTNRHYPLPPDAEIYLLQRVKGG